MSNPVPRPASAGPWAAVRGRIGGFMADMGSALGLGPVRQGLLGTTLLALGSFTPAYLPQSSPWWGPMRSIGLDNWWAKAIGTALVIGAMGLLITAWLRLRPTVYEHVKHWSVLLWWSLPLLAAPPIFSHDAYSYAAQGWLIHNGLNPYETSPSVLPGPFADQVSWVWRYTAAPYGPLALQISHGMVVLAGLDPYLSAVLMRLPALVGVAMIVRFLPRLAHLVGVDVRTAAWFSTINPVLVIDLVGGAHNDALMIGFVVWALHEAWRGRFWWALVLIGLGASIKQPAFLAAYPVAIIGSGWASCRPRDVVRFVPRAAVALAVPIGVFVLVSLATGLGFGWLYAVTVPGLVVTMAPFSLLGWGVQSIIDQFGLDPTGRVAKDAAQAVGLVIMAVVVGWLILRRSRTEPMVFLSYAYLAVAIFAPAMHTWYLLWGGLLLPLTSPSARVIRWAAAATGVLMVYGAGNLAWRNDALALALASLAAAAIYLRHRASLRSRSGHRPATQGGT